jgi:hypothetical protein
MQKIIALLGVVLLATGCAAISALPVSPGALSSSINTPNPDLHSQTSVTLQEANFVVVKTNLVGQAKGFSLLGVLSIVPAKFTRAMDRLYVQAAIETGKPQALAQVVVEKSSVYLILFSIPSVSIRADVVEFVPGTALVIPTPVPSPPGQQPENKTGANKSSTL